MDTVSVNTWLRKVFSFAKILLRNVWTFLYLSYSRWGRDSVFFGAAAVAFNVLVTLIPLSVLIFQFSALAVAGDVSFRIEFSRWLTSLNPFVPESVIADMQRAVTGRDSTVSIIGFLTLLWMVSRLFGTIRTALDRVYEAPGRSVVWGKLYDLFLAFLVALCFLLAAIFTIATRFAVGSGAGIVLTSVPIVGPVLSGLAARILSLTFTFLVFFLLYWASPNRAVPLKLSALTALLAMILTAAGTEIFMRAVSAPDWGVVYGSFIGIMASLIWLYWLCVIFIGSAEVGAVFHMMRSGAKRRT